MSDSTRDVELAVRDRQRWQTVQPAFAARAGMRRVVAVGSVAVLRSVLIDEALPALVRRYVERALASDARCPSRVRITQVGEMRMRPGGRWLRFVAEEWLAVDRVAFRWKARFPMFGPLSLGVVDGYANGDASLAVSVLGIPLRRQTGADLAVGEGYRYLSELPWVPNAIAANRELRWTEIDTGTVGVAVSLGGRCLSMTIEFSPDGDITGGRTQARPMTVGGTFAAIPWGGTLGHYAIFGRFRIPTRAEVYWDLEGGRFVYWRGEVTSIVPIFGEGEMARRAR
jgi:hypothetical protein